MSGTAHTGEAVGCDAGVWAAVPGLIGDWWRPFRQLCDVAVVHVDLSPDRANERAALAALDCEESRRAGRFRHTGAKRRYVLCRSSLRSLLCGALDCRNQDLAFGVAEHGKPFALVGGSRAPISFNVSHSGRHGLVALAHRGAVGVDVEEWAPRRNLDVLISGTLAPSERAEMAAMRATPKLHRFLSLWTMKEALSKAHGKGMSMNVSSFSIPRGMRQGSRSGVFRFPDMPDVEWRLTNISTDGFAAAVAHASRARD